LHRLITHQIQQADANRAQRIQQPGKLGDQRTAAPARGVGKDLALSHLTDHVDLLRDRGGASAINGELLQAEGVGVEEGEIRREPAHVPGYFTRSGRSCPF
jgi:hypothetical protein